PGRERGAELGDGAIEVGIAAPAKMLCAVQDFFDPYREDHVGVRANPGAPRGDVAQQRVEFTAGLAALDRIDPHEHSVCIDELFPPLVGEPLVVARRFGLLGAPRHGGLFRSAPYCEKARSSLALNGRVNGVPTPAPDPEDTFSPRRAARITA